MEINARTRLGPYALVAPIGAGGMGEVWKARDTRLERNVAVKILPAALARDPQFRARFDREAKTVSQLNHPHICTLHDVGSDSGVDYLVMELLDGETLADRISRGPLPLPEVLKYGAQIASALDRAHRAGIAHRDLKPGNVMITKSGAKLLDFGLAKVNTISISSPDSPTEQHKPLTAQGSILGTFQYMAPEQLEGQNVDHRTDIFALGCVLYEMATATRAFDGKTRTSLIAAIVAGEPRPLHELQPLTPLAFEHLVERCLAKDPDDRWQSAHDVAQELQWIAQAPRSASGAAAKPTRGVSRTAAWLLAAASLVTAAALAVLLATKRNDTRRIVASLNPPVNTRFTHLGDFGGPVAVSPNGRHIAFTASSAGTGSALWIRATDSLAVKQLPGTAGARFPFWSPDSTAIGFFAAGKLRRIEIAGGLPVNVCDAPDPRGGAWTPDGEIVFTPDTRSGILRVNVEGGAPVPLTTIDVATHTTHRWPAITPDGKHMLFFAADHADPLSERSGIYVIPIHEKGAAARRITSSISQGVIARGLLLYLRAETLVARRINGDFQVSGDALPLANNVLWDEGIWRAAFAVSDSGILVYHPADAGLTSRISISDRSGKLLRTLGPPGYYFDIDLSPDEKKIAISEGDPKSAVFLVEIDRNVKTRFTFSDRFANSPVWHPDGATILYSQPAETRTANNYGRVFSKSASGSGTARMICDARVNTYPTDVSPDGRYMLLNRGELGAWDIHFAEQSAPCRPLPLVATPHNEGDGAFSPDGRWVAYTSSENGIDDVFLTTFPPSGGKWQVSHAGGRLPRWRRDGKEMYYLAADERIVAVDVTLSTDDASFGVPKPLFAINSRGIGNSYDVSADGQRFVVNQLTEQVSTPAVIISNWEPKD